MKTHRQIRQSKTIGDPSSKFAYNQDLDAAVNEKHEVIDWATDKIFTELDKLMSNQIKYNENEVMSQSQKKQCIVEAFMKLKDKYDL
jgi:spore coat protein CotF